MSRDIVHTCPRPLPAPPPTLRQEQRDLAGALRRAHQWGLNYEAAALSEPQTAAALLPLADQGWRVLRDRRWPGQHSRQCWWGRLTDHAE